MNLKLTDSYNATFKAEFSHVSLEIAIADPDNLCESNNYNGDYASVSLSLADAMKLRDFLNEHIS